MSRKRPAAAELDRASRTPAQIEQTFQRSIVKALEERLCVIQAKHSAEDDAAHRRVFAMLGSTGNVYHVTISCEKVACDCPHGRHGAVCKHVLYLFIRKLKVARNSPLLRSKTLAEAEWLRLFPARAPENLVDVDDKTQRAYQLLQQGKNARAIEADLDAAAAAASVPSANEEEEEKKVERTQTGRARAILEADSECPICCCEIEPDEATTWCRAQCGGNLHTKCFDTWRDHVGAADTTCPYCRSPWWEPIAAAAANSNSKKKKQSHLVISKDEEGYQNLAWRG